VIIPPTEVEEEESEEVVVSSESEAENVVFDVDGNVSCT